MLYSIYIIAIANHNILGFRVKSDRACKGSITAITTHLPAKCPPTHFHLQRKSKNISMAAKCSRNRLKKLTCKANEEAYTYNNCCF